MPEFTKEQIEKELGVLDDRTPAAVHYLKQELKRRERSGRPKVSEYDRREQNRLNQQKFREKRKKKKRA